MILLIASAAGLPGTVGGLAQGTLAQALTSWPTGDRFLRLPLLLLDATILVAGGSLLRRRPPLAVGHGRARRLNWLALGVVAAAVVGPVVAPEWTVGRWYGPVAAAAAGTGAAPPALALSRIPPLLSGLLGLVAAWALAQRWRGREWLPAPARAALGAVALGWLEVRRVWRRRGLAGAPVVATDRLWVRLQGAADRVMALLRPFEERYYAAAAVMVAVALIYIIGR